MPARNGAGMGDGRCKVSAIFLSQEVNGCPGMLADMRSIDKAPDTSCNATVLPAVPRESR